MVGALSLAPSPAAVAHSAHCAAAPCHAHTPGHQRRLRRRCHWVRTGATLDPTSGQAPTYSDHGGYSFAELLEAGSNAGARPDLTQLLHLRRSSYGMAMETSIKIRAVGSHTSRRIWKNDVGSGQAGDVHFTIDLHPGIAQAIGFSGYGDVEVARC
jgi:hypothetical protein